MIDTRSLEKFATAARRTLIAQVTAQLDRVLRSEGALRATHADAIDQLKIEIDRHTRAGVIERVAYTWFNRFCALRMLDANHLQTPLVVSPAAGESQQHTGSQVRVAGYGPGAANVVGLIDQTDLFFIIRDGMRAYRR